MSEKSFAAVILSPQTAEAATRKRCSMLKSVIKSFPKFTVNHMYQSLFFNKVADLYTSGCLMFLEGEET